MTKGITPWLAEKQRGESTHPLDNVLPLDQLFAMQRVDFDKSFVNGLKPRIYEASCYGPIDLALFKNKIGVRVCSIKMHDWAILVKH